MEHIEAEIERIKERNARVEADKAWETSLFRKALILVATYVVASFALYSIGVINFLSGAIIPTLGFFLSTLTFPLVKKFWIKRYFKKNIEP